MADAQEKLILSGINSEYMAHLYAQYCVNPNKVDESWQSFFADLNDGETALLRELNGASWTPAENKKAHRSFQNQGADILASESSAVENAASLKAGSKTLNDNDARQVAKDSIKALMLIRAYRMRGHLIASLDPLELKESKAYPELSPEHYGFNDSDYDRPIFIDGVLGLP